MATQGPDSDKIAFLKQTLITNLREIAEGDVDKLSLDVLNDCVALLKNELAKVTANTDIAVVNAPMLPPPPPPPLPPTNFGEPRTNPVTTNTPTETTPLAAVSHYQTLTERLQNIKMAITEETGQFQSFTPLMQSRLNGIEEVEAKRMVFLKQRAAERADPNSCLALTQPLLAEVVNLRRALKPTPPKPVLTEVEAALLRERNMAAYLQRMAENEKKQRAQEIDAMLQSFIFLDLNCEQIQEDPAKESKKMRI